VTRLENLAGEDYYLTDHILAFRETSEGLRMIGHDYHGFGYYDYFLRYPVSDGTTYEYSSTMVEQSTILVKVNYEVARVPAGEFRVFTYRIWFGSGMPFTTMSFAPGVGIVRISFPWNGYLQLLVSADVCGGNESALGPARGLCSP
jgi:hypothetical protein